MTIGKIYAHVSCSNLEQSAQWYGKLFGRSPDARPMKHLAEWHQGEAAGLQLFENRGNAGHSTLTLIVEELRNEQQRLSEAGMSPGAVEPGDKTSLLRINDPDGNLVVLAQPGPA